MGGMNSTRWANTRTRRLTSDYPQLDVLMLWKNDCLGAGTRFGLRLPTSDVSNFGGQAYADRIVLTWRGPSYSEDCILPVWLSWTRPNYGGSRPWFLCPHCGRRVQILYYQRDSFACRTCSDLAYQSTRLSAVRRAERKIGQLKVKLLKSEGMARGLYAGTRARIEERISDLEDSLSQLQFAELCKHVRHLPKNLAEALWP